MRILMLGWEFPPVISGGLGTACFGLTKALDRLGEHVYFVLPKPVDADTSSHVTLLSSAAFAEPRTLEQIVRAEDIRSVAESASPAATETVERMEIFTLPLTLRGSYGNIDAPEQSEVRSRLEEIASLEERARKGDRQAAERIETLRTIQHAEDLREIQAIGGAQGEYGGDLVGDAWRYAKLAAALARRIDFDVIHAHDWLTYPAGIAAREVSGKPLVCHMHATEFDRSGENVNRPIADIERMGLHAADRIITVSKLTRDICVSRYGADPAKIAIVYNGVEHDHTQPQAGARIESRDKIVLFLGRITMQKGPEYFIAAAKRVLEKIDNVKFIVAGSGDMALRMIEMAAALGIGHKFTFTGFLRGRDVERVFQMADCYVMPSVSEPFGIAPLEAISHDVPVIISKQSGVSEVLTHALKVDFWDIDEMANKIAAVLKYPALSQTLRTHGDFELRGLTWDGAAARCVKVYADAIASRIG